MKEYEKLSLDACRKAYGTETAILDYIGGYQEGFLKCREMALDYMETTGECYFGLDTIGEREV
jgi:hypothetical protein